MVVKNTKTKNKKFNYNRNETTIKMFNYLRAGIRIRKTRKMVEVQNTIFHNKDSSMTKMRIKTHNPMKMRIKTHNPMEMRIKAHILMKMVKYNLNKNFKSNNVEKNENGVRKEQRLVDY